ncbi:HIT family protein [Gudongella sp. SC589]|jgi:diadenosine tetraphosphate (Ap4A) HIT family hydrolase|uniref:HIT family protein n=1 Tax=Gudongella sp. SC589 TaxID=3385990 RepID=UPI003904CE97
MDCIFCNLDDSKIILENEGARAIFDIFPVNEGHMLIVPKNHIVSYFDAREEDKKYLWKLVEECKKYLDEEYKPDGYNVGINCGEAAGQTVMHLHIHLIPRYVGDIENPRGGVRGVIPEKRIY